MDWCRKAVSYIRFKPDREQVCMELMHHLTDQQRALESVGLEREVAMAQAVAEMGEAEEMGRALNLAHNTTANHLWEISSVLLVFVLLLLALQAFIYTDVMRVFQNEVSLLTNQPFNEGWHELLDPQTVIQGHADSEARIGKTFLCYGTAAEVEAGAYRFQVPYGLLVAGRGRAGMGEHGLGGVQHRTLACTRTDIVRKWLIFGGRQRTSLGICLYPNQCGA